MGNHLAAKNKLKTVASKVEKALYTLKYGNKETKILDTKLYFIIYDICIRENIDFPLIKHKGNFYLDGSNPQLYCIMVKLADEYEIILDYKKLTKKFA